MKIEVARCPDDVTREFWTLRLELDTFKVYPVRFERWVACNDHDPGNRIALWKYPDLDRASTIEEPELPQWAKDDARTFILNQIHF